MKIFTVEEANALLPTVRGILSKIQRAYKRLSVYQPAARKAAEAAETGGGGVPNGLRYAALLTELTTKISELEALGVSVNARRAGCTALLADGRRRRARMVARCRSRICRTHPPIDKISTGQFSSQSYTVKIPTLTH